jgi:ribosomal protein S18 acetylase RimI-like enzyme
MGHTTEVVQIAIAARVDEELVEALARLVPQLGTGAPIPTAEHIREIVRSPSTTLLLARDGAEGGRIVGILILIIFRLATGLRAWIEDVVVDSAARGKGIGEALNREALEIARSRGATTVDLTSRPAREAANRLYQRLGFVSRETNVYRYVFKDEARDL